MLFFGIFVMITKWIWEKRTVQNVQAPVDTVTDCRPMCRLMVYIHTGLEAGIPFPVEVSKNPAK